MATEGTGHAVRGEVLEGRYRLVEVLGSGGMGEVWKAVDARLDRTVALKVIIQHPGSDPRLSDRFRQEARATARLTHPHIVTVHDHGEAELGGRPVLFLVMELVQGRPMGAFTTTEEPSIETVVLWGTQICAGLAAAHRAGVVHRDIKPANIMVHGDGELDLKICDFGIARLVEESGPGLTGTGAAIGTPAYMSPEQCRGERSIDGRSDLYSLGCLLYELLSGAPPFAGAGWSVLTQHLNRRPEPVSTLRAGVPQDLDQLILRLLHKDPDRRPATAEEVAGSLLGVLDNLTNVPRAAREFPGATTPDASTALRQEAPPQTTPYPESDSRRDVVPGPSPHPGRLSIWAGLHGAGVLYVQFILLTSWHPFWTAVLAVSALLAVTATAYLGEGSDPGSEGGPGLPSLFMALLCTGLAAVFLLFWPPSPWWTALLFSVLGAPALIFSSMGIRGVVESTIHREHWQADVGTAAGMLNGIVLTGLLAARHTLPVPLAILIGAVTWVLVALLVALVLPASRDRTAQS